MADAEDTPGEATPSPPPNLRVATDENRECDTCTHFSRGKCTKYNNLPVDDEWICDSWVKGSQQDTDTDQPFTGKSLKEANTEALVRVRAHSRRAAAKQ
jgi:hypothetical protein